MAGLVPAIHVFARGAKDVDARHKAGHDGEYRFSVIGKRSSGFDPRVVATCRFLASRSAASRITDTEASSPFRRSVLPTARLGSGRPTSLFCSRAWIAAS